jgi:hypothetical protein
VTFSKYFCRQKIRKYRLKPMGNRSKAAATRIINLGKSKINRNPTVEEVFDDSDEDTNFNDGPRPGENLHDDFFFLDEDDMSSDEDDLESESENNDIWK